MNEFHAPDSAAVPWGDFFWRSGYEPHEWCQNKRNFINRGYCECDGVDSMSRDSLSSDLGDTWHRGPPIHHDRRIGTGYGRSEWKYGGRGTWGLELWRTGQRVGGTARECISEVRELIIGAAPRLPHSSGGVSSTHGWFKVVWCDIVWTLCRIVVLPDEKERYGWVSTCLSAGMVQFMALWLRVVRTRTITRLDRLHRLRRADLGGKKGKWRCVVPWISTHNHTVKNLTLVCPWVLVTVWNCWHCQLSVECLPVSVHMCSASHLQLYLLDVNMYTTRLLWLWYARVLLENFQHLVACAQAISAHGKVVHLRNTFYFALPCPITHVIMDRDLRGFPRSGHLPKIHTLDGARGPVVAIIAMSGTKMHRELGLRPGGTTRDLGRCRSSDLGWPWQEPGKDCSEWCSEK